jgi:hypothetical protein
VITGLFEALRAIGGIDTLPAGARNLLLNISPGLQGLLMALVCVFLTKGLIPPKFTEWLFPKDTSAPKPQLREGPAFGATSSSSDSSTASTRATDLDGASVVTTQVTV